ncbi:hypothetical protein BH24ACT4_BH24ACT4_11440 [soil metagenome]
MLRSVVAIVGTAVMILGCSSSDEDDAKHTPALCEAAAFAKERLMEPDGLTFVDLVEADEPTVPVKGATGALTLARMGDPDLDLGPYRPAVDFLVQRSTAWDPEFAEETEMPERTDSVVGSAEAMDSAFAEGACS